jgi:hypothetical protein
MNESTGLQTAISRRTAPDDEEERLNGAAEAAPIQSDEIPQSTSIVASDL